MPRRSLPPEQFKGSETMTLDLLPAGLQWTSLKASSSSWGLEAPAVGLRVIRIVHMMKRDILLINPKPLLLSLLGWVDSRILLVIVIANG
jgi:hypothetical protein